MDLFARLTPDEQLPCVQHVAGPLVVSAGAGTGKTFMLTRRIAYALLHPDESGVETIDQVLAITFTEKAAAEIRQRVRQALRAAGLVEEALKVDGAWISTIHGACSRILHEHALELGLDPAFAILGDTDRDDLVTQAINDVLREGGPGHQALFETYRTDAIESMLRSLIERAASVPGGLSALAPSPEPRPAWKAADNVLRAMRAIIPVLEDSRASKAPDALARLTSADGTEAFDSLAHEQDTTYEELSGALARFNPKFGNLGKQEEMVEANRDFRQAYAEACADCLSGLAAPLAQDLLGSLAPAVIARFGQLKRDRRALDQNDLLTHALSALRDNEGIAAEYCNRFRMVMVDEFQDTSQLQIEIVGLLDGRDDEHLCTVGDAQQSIYRFRGADVNTYRAHRQATAKRPGVLHKQLTHNFRSHHDVIAFVNRVFSQPQVFGGRDGEFIALDTPADRKSGLAQDRSRVDVVAVTNGWRAATGAERLAVTAQAIRDRFWALHEEGNPWGSMVILLGAMSHADAYADSLRASGVPCVVAGGSIFDRAPEAQTVLALTRVLANPYDDPGLSQVLVSGMFQLGADEMLALATDSQGKRRHLWDGLASHVGAPAGGKGEAEGANPRLALAANALAQGLRAADTQPPSEVLLGVVLTSGWLDRLQGQGAQGQAVAANVLKAVRLAKDEESAARGVRSMAGVAHRLTQRFADGMKEAPGTLNAKGEDAVRIMTIHAAKGLEFPIVALADFHDLHNGTGSLSLLVRGTTLYASLSLPKPKDQADSVTKLQDLAKEYQGPCPDDERGGLSLKRARTAAAFSFAVADADRREELAEALRKFYVGATRPREALVIAVQAQTKKPKKDEPICYPPVIEALRSGLLGDREDGQADFPTDFVDFGGYMPAQVEHHVLTKDEEGGLLVDGEAFDDSPIGGARTGDTRTVEVPEFVPAALLLPPSRPAPTVHAGEFSYSRIAPAGSHGVQAPHTGDPDDLEEEVAQSQPSPHLHGAGELERAAAASAKATAFGSAFHGAAQWMAEQVRTQRAAGEKDRLGLPNEDRLAQIAAAWQVDPQQLPRLREALQRLLGSDVMREALSHPTLEPEANLYITILGPQGEPLHLNGSIDLFCHDARSPEEGQRACIVDYKTGGSPEETAEVLQAKHLLQAQCYAYAALSQGFAGVDVRFVRVEVPQGGAEGKDAGTDGVGQPQVVPYSFDARQKDELEQSIRAAYVTARDRATKEGGDA